jgi:hypothetical protein
MFPPAASPSRFQPLEIEGATSSGAPSWSPSVAVVFSSRGSSKVAVTFWESQDFREHSENSWWMKRPAPCPDRQAIATMLRLPPGRGLNWASLARRQGPGFCGLYILLGPFGTLSSRELLCVATIFATL